MLKFLPEHVKIERVSGIVCNVTGRFFLQFFPVGHKTRVQPTPWGGLRKLVFNPD